MFDVELEGDSVRIIGLVQDALQNKSPTAS